MYQLFTAMDIYEIILRWHRGYGIRPISRALHIDRKTVQRPKTRPRYLKLAQKAGISREEPLPQKAQLLTVLAAFIPNNERPHPARNVFEPYRNDTSALITKPSDPPWPGRLKPWTGPGAQDRL